MLIRLMRDLSKLLALLWAEQAICAAGRDLGAGASARSLASARHNAVAG
jgi:hypothetical protein